MSIILENYQAPQSQPDQLQVALQAFIEAARGSEQPFTIDQLTVMVECELHTMTLQEFGGFGSWIKRYFTGMDNDLVSEIEDGIKGIDTETKKSQALDEIDKYLEQATGTTGDQKAATIASLFVPLPGSFIVPLVARLVIKAGNSGSRKAYREMLLKLRGEIKNLKVK